MTGPSARRAAVEVVGALVLGAVLAHQGVPWRWWFAPILVVGAVHYWRDWRYLRTER